MKIIFSIILLVLQPQLYKAEYIGCFKDGNPRDLPQKVHNHEISSESCRNQCKDLSFKFAGLQFAYLCFCGNSFGRYGQIPEGKCSSSCLSKKDSFCGGEWSSSIYRTGYLTPEEKKRKKIKVKRDEVVLFDNVKQYHKPDDRSFTIDVSSLKRSDVPRHKNERKDRSENTNTYPYSYYSNAYNADTATTNNYPSTYGGEQVAAAYGESQTQTQGLDWNIKVSLGDASTAAQQSTDSSSPAATLGYNTARNDSAYSAPQDQSRAGYPTQGSIPSANAPVPEPVPAPAPAPAQYQPAVANPSSAPSSYPQSAYSANNASVNEATSSPVTAAPTLAAPVPATAAQEQTGAPAQTNYPEAYANNNNQGAQAMASQPTVPTAAPAVASQNSATYPNVATATVTGPTQAPATATQSQYGTGSARGSSAYNATAGQVGAAPTHRITYSESPLNVTAAPATQPGSSSYANSAGIYNNGAPQAVETPQNQTSVSGSYPAQDAAKAPYPAPAPAPSQSYAPYPSPSPAPSQPYAPYPAPSPAPSQSYAPYPAPAPAPSQSYAPYPAPVPAPAPYPATAANASPSNTTGGSGSKSLRTPCLIERKIAHNLDDSFVPNCKEDGSYAEVQCFEHEGFGRQCWCVDKDGQEVKGTRNSDGKRPTCGQITNNQTQMTTKDTSNASLPESKLSQCQRERKMATSAFITDIFVPDCNKDGSFVRLQCFKHDDGKQCWCVDPTGQEMKGTRTSNGTTPTCAQKVTTTVVSHCQDSPYGCCADGATNAKGPKEEGCPPAKSYAHPITPAVPPAAILSKCQQERLNVKAGAMDIFLPVCEPDGRFKEIQCYTFPGDGFQECWCVNQVTGMELAGTRTKGEQPNCKAVHATTPPPFVIKPTNPPAKQQPAVVEPVICIITIHGCCPDNKTAAAGPGHHGCKTTPVPAKPVTLPPHPPTAKPVTKPTIPTGAAKEVCVSLLLAQMWYPQLKNRYSLYYLQLDKEITGSLKQIYSVHPDFVGVHTSGVRPAANPFDPKGPDAIELFFVLFFREMVADPLATLRDHVLESGKLGPRMAVKNSLKNLGVPFDHTGCPPQGYKSVPLVIAPQKPPSQKPALVHPKPALSPAPHGPEKTLLACHLAFESQSAGYVPDISGRGNNAKISNVDITPHPLGGCGNVGQFSNGNLSFDGAKFAPKPKVGITIAMWVHLSTITGRQSLFDTIASSSSDHQGNFHFEVIDGHLRWFHRDLKGSVIFDTHTAKPVVPIGQWTHVVGTYDMQEGASKLYVNVALVNQTKGAGSLAQDWTERAGIGSHKGKRFLNGFIDEVYIFTSAVTPHEIARLACACADATHAKGVWPYCKALAPQPTGTTATSKPSAVGQQPACGQCVVPPQCAHPCPVVCQPPCPVPHPAPAPGIMTTKAPVVVPVTPPPLTTKPSTPPSTPATSPTVPVITKPTVVVTTEPKPMPPITRPATTMPPTTRPPVGPTTLPLPVNGNYAPWSKWTECTATCGGGMQQKTRTCTNPTPNFGGSNCAAMGPDFESRNCNAQPCPVDGSYSNWSEFTHCTRTCGGGMQARTRQCDNPNPQYGGMKCARLGPANETRACNTFYCPINGNYSEWSSFLTCSSTCGGGSQYRTRTCTNPPSQHGGASCSNLGVPRESRACNPQPCPIDGGYSSFTKWSDCSETCGGGSQIRTRTCTNPAPKDSGKDCSSDGPDFETRMCNTQKCPVDGGFTTFTNYSECSKTCGGGSQLRTRSCINPEPQYSGQNCTGDYKQSRTCNTQPCPIDGGFSEWENYTACSSSCGGGNQMRTRTCTNPSPSNGGKPCAGSPSESKKCNTQACPVDGGYSDWGSYGQCSVTCDGGNQQRTRMCTNPAPQQGGMDCSQLGYAHETRECHTNPCPVSGGFAEWSVWTKCSVSCGGGVSKRSRTCTNPPPKYSGTDCSLLGPDMETQQCNLMQCAVHGKYSQWNEWTPCTVTCGGGENMRSRTCTNPSPAFGGKDCSALGPSTETGRCKVDACPVNGGYSLWSVWTPCSVTCGNGLQYRERKCDNPHPANGGSDCSMLGPPAESKACFTTLCVPSVSPGGWSECTQTCGGGQKVKMAVQGSSFVNITQQCNVNPCPVNGGYSIWSKWAECSATCGGGVTSRSRTCTDPIPLFGGKRCDGLPVETKECNVKVCPAPKIAIRSCREFYERCHSKTDGLYTIYVQEPNTAHVTKVYCDMTRDGGGWTLLVTSATNQEWTADNIKKRNEIEPSLSKDFSILYEADAIKSIAVGSFLYRLEAGDRGSNGGIWSAPQSYSFTPTASSFTGVTEVKKFGSWASGPLGIGKRMPWLSLQDHKSLLTTSDRESEDWHGTIVSKVAESKPAPWIAGAAESPKLIWYWLKEAATGIKPPSSKLSDTMCPSPVIGGYTEWNQWSTCAVTCGGGSHQRTRSCINPQPQNGGKDCSALGGDMETRVCNAKTCPGVAVDGGYSEWYAWTECTATCGGGTRMHNRTCNNPTPENGGKTCVDQGLGSEIETQLCNTQTCPSKCVVPCINAGRCVAGECHCPPGLYNGSYCQIAICKKPCKHGGTCVNPSTNQCSCPPGYKGKTCGKPSCRRLCRNGGKCVGPNICQCKKDYTGKWCGKSTCGSNCLNGGLCVSKQCKCQQGYSGKSCEIVRRCELPKPSSPCYAGLSREVENAAPADANTPCLNFLTEVLSYCSYSNLSYVQEMCEEQCDPTERDTCQRIWNGTQCKSTEVKYYYDRIAKQCLPVNYHGCLGNQNVFPTKLICENTCKQGNVQPTAVTPTAPGTKQPPVPPSYYWYFLMIGKGAILGQPPLTIKGKYQLLNLGFRFTTQTYLETQISVQDCLVDPDKCQSGFTVGIKLKFDASIVACSAPRYIIDTGPSVGGRGLSLYTASGKVGVKIASSTNTWKVETVAPANRWFYIILTWRVDAGLSVYVDDKQKAALSVGQAVSGPAPYSSQPNFVMGRGLGETAESLCGTFYVASLAVFKRYVVKMTALQIYQFFHVNIVSPTPLPDYYIFLRIANMAGTAVTLIPGDNQPAKGFVIQANVIAEIKKTIPAAQPIEFSVLSGNGKPLFLNNTRMMSLTPTQTLGKATYIVVVKGAVNKVYYLVLRITNMAGGIVRLIPNDKQPPEGFTIGKNTIAVIKKKVSSPLPVTFAAENEANKTLYINYKPQIILTPTDSQGSPIPLTVTSNPSPTVVYYLGLSMMNFAGKDVVVHSSDNVPAAGFSIKMNMMAKITKTVKNLNPVTLRAVGKDGKPAYINNQANFVVIPKAEKDKFVQLKVTASITQPKPTPGLGQKFFMVLQVTNNAGVKVTLIPSDNRPPEGFSINPNSVFTVTKETNTNKAVEYFTVDAETLSTLQINKKKRVSIVPSELKNPPVSVLSITGGSGETPVVPSVTPTYFWSFLTVIDGKITGTPTFTTDGNVQPVDGGLFLDGVTGSIKTHLSVEEALTNPDLFSEGFTFGIKLKFPQTVMTYNIPRYIVDTGEKSVSTRGVSLYILDKKLVFELATSSTRWKVESDVSPDKWIYLVITWRLGTGLSMYIDGKQTAKDAGGVGVKNFQVAKQPNNFFIGRNIDGQGAYFGSFYISSFVVFHQFLKPQAIYNVYKYYFSNAVIQPTKLYFANVIATNNAPYDVLLTSSDNMPPGGFHIKSKDIVNIKKKLARPAVLTLSAVSADASNKIFLINGQSRLKVTPYEYEQQETTITINEAVNNGDMAPATLYYLTLKVQNKATRDAQLFFSDNDPPEGFRMKPNYIEVVTKEVTSPADISFHAVLPGTEEPLLLNGEHTQTFKPSVSKGAPVSLEITSESGGGGVVPAEPITSSYYWSLKTISNGFVEGNPSFKVNGKVQVADGGLAFDGLTSSLGAQVGKVDCFINPAKCTKGLALGARIKLDASVLSYTKARYLIDTGAKSDDKQGLSLYVVGGKLHFMLATADKIWEVKTPAVTNTWFYLIVTWSQSNGLSLYVDGEQKATIQMPQPSQVRTVEDEPINLLLGRNVNSKKGTLFAKFFISSLAVFNKDITPQQIGSVYSYYTKYVPSPSKFYIMLQVINRSKKKVLLKPSDNYPAAGFPVNVNVIAKIKKEVSRATVVTFSAVEQGTNKVLFLNGKSHVSVNPSYSALRFTNLTLTAAGQVVPPTTRDQGKLEEAGVTAPPVSPSLSWFLNSMKDNVVPGNPPLTGHGKITAIAGGLSFDGMTSYLDSQLPVTDCFLNPDLCVAGFSFGAKLKFDQAAVTINAPKYLVDSGASSNHRGVSMYLQMTALHVNIITSTMMYKAAVPVTADKWFFVTSTFSMKTGLDLYVDGKLVSSDKIGTASAGHAVLADSNNFVLGKDVSAAGSSFGKFSMASFITFKQILSATNVGAVYSYFWRRGSGGEGKTFYISLEIKNNVGGNAVLLPSDNHPPQGFEVAKGNRFTITKSMVSGMPVKFTAIDPMTKARYFLNNQNFIQVKPTHSKDAVTEVTLTQTGVENPSGQQQGIHVIPAPPVAPSHSWSLTTIANDKIIGYPSLSVLGTANLVEGGIQFDGISTLLEGHLESSECLVDPDKCSSGFSLGTKIKLAPEVLGYTMPKYVIDSGARSTKTRGVSMYIVGGKLFFLLVSSQKEWKVEVPLTVDSWMYVVATWKKDIGLDLYVNHEIATSDKTGTLIGDLKTYPGDKNLCVGRDVGGIHYAKFVMGSLASFNTFFSKQVCRAVSVFYWTNAGSGPSSIGYIALTILNKAGESALVLTSDNQPAHGIMLPSEYSTSIMKVIANDHPITLTAKDSVTKKQLLLNNEKILSVTSSITKNAPLAVVISASSISGGVTSTGQHYVSMKIVNKSGKDIQLIPSDANPPEGYTVKKGYMMTISKPTKGNLPINFRAVDPSNQKLMEINGKEGVTITPTPQKGTPTLMEILFPGQKPGQAQQYFITLCVINRSGKDVVLRSSDNNPKQGWTVKKGYKMTITKGTMSTEPITLVAQDAAKHTALAINNKMQAQLTPKSTKGPCVTLELSGQVVGAKKAHVPRPGAKSPKYYVTLRVANRAGKKSIIAPSFRSVNEHFHVGTGPAIKITKEFKSKEPLLLKAFDPETNTALLINKRQGIMVTPALSNSSAVVVELTVPSQDAKNHPVHYITLLCHNKVGREARVMPSKGREGGYVVKPNGFLKVSMIIRGELLPKPFTFRAEDVETESALELNGVITPLSITPGTIQDISTNVTITAPAPNVKPVHSWSMLAIKDNGLTGETATKEIYGNPSLFTHGDLQISDGGVTFDGETSHAVGELTAEDCVIDPEKCPSGFAVGTKLKFGMKSTGHVGPRFIFDTGATHAGNYRGVSLFIQKGRLTGLVKGADRLWKVDADLPLNKWFYVMLTWKKGEGLKMYYNADLQADDGDGLKMLSTTTVPFKKNIVIGRSVSNDGPLANFQIASLTIFGSYMLQSDVDKAYIFFWSSLSAKIYYASIRVSNQAGREVLLLPDKGNPKGFNIQADSTLEVTLMSMSTDGAIIKPVLFTAKDAETMAPFLINYGDDPFPVKPLDGKKEFTNLVVSVQTPRIHPKYFWQTSQVINGEVLGSSPKLLAHDLLNSDVGGVVLNGKDSWIDAGDFAGECITDPDKCNAGMTVGVKVKLDDAVGTTEGPHYILDSGGSNMESRGVSLYVNDGSLYAVVSQANAVWQVKSKFDSLSKWHYITATWSNGAGLTLYVDGVIKERSKVILQDGGHLENKNTALVMGRSSVGPPYGYTKMNIGSVVFFDTLVPQEDIQKIFLYYWGNVTSSASDRFIKVRFDNKAGQNVKVTPIRGIKKNKGYIIQPHMSLDLSFVEKGPLNNIPVTFKASSPSAHLKLLINGESDVLEVAPSSTRNSVVTGVITSSFVCPQPDGFFADLSSKVRYIHCRQHVPHAMMCPDDMTWDDTQKTCVGEGRETTLKVPTYFFNVNFKNDAGEEANIISDDSKQTTNVSAGESASLKFTKNLSLPVHFRAVEKASGKPLKLQDQPRLNLEPSTDPDKITEVSITKPANFYTISTKTGSKFDSGTDSHVFVRLTGSQGSSELLPLQTKGATNFQAGQTDSFRVEASDLGRLLKISVKQDNTGRSPHWFLEKVSVNDSKLHTYDFPINDWIKGQEEHEFDANNPLEGEVTCSPSCQNEGVCVYGHCQCKNSFEGPQCQTAICQQSCLNGGACINPSTNECKCSSGYMGKLCDKPMCSEYCRHGGVCSGPDKCACPPGFTGSHCETPVCKVSCMNGATCKNDTCICKPNYSGPTCNIVNMCQLSVKPGPCRPVITREVTSPSLERSPECTSYLQDVLKNCPHQNTTFAFDECQRICDEDNVCNTVWNSTSCLSGVSRFFFNPLKNLCEKFNFNGCLGNANNFDTLLACNKVCSAASVRARKRRQVPNKTDSVRLHGFKPVLKKLYNIKRHTA